MICPYSRMCKKYPNCPPDYKDCSLFKRFIEKKALNDIKPVKWKPKSRK